jgi:hypothetical protein
VPTKTTRWTMAAIAALATTLVGTPNAAGPGVSDVLVALGAMTALALARAPVEPPR